MLDDRSYMRSDYRPALPLTYVLIITNVVVFVFALVLERQAGGPITRYFALSLEGLSRGFIWQFITFQFLHAGLLHLLINMLVLFFFGRPVEETVGRRSFLKFYLAAGVAGGMLEMIFSFLLRDVFPPRPVVGASAGVYGVVAAFAAMHPERRLTLLIFFFIPVSMKAKVLLWIAIGMAVLGMIAPYGRMAHAAHLGGIFAGLIYVMAVVQGRGWSFLWRGQSAPRSSWGPSPPSTPSRWRRSAKPAGSEEMSSAEFISREVDPILDKISRHGIHSLTEEERKILEAARNRMAKR